MIQEISFKPIQALTIIVNKPATPSKFNLATDSTSTEFLLFDMTLKAQNRNIKDVQNGTVTR